MRRLVCCTVGVLLFAVSPALAASGGPQWTVTAVSRPTNLPPGDQSGKDVYVVTLINTGGAASDGSPVTITDELPRGLSLDSAGAVGEDMLAEADARPAGANFSCVSSTCTYSGVVVPDQTLSMTFPVDVSAGAPSSVLNVVRVAGGGAPDAAVQTPTTIGSGRAFGVAPGGESTALSSTQAGAHPDVTTSLAFNTVNTRGSLAGDPKNIVADLPSGFAGADLVDTPSCPSAQLLRQECSVATQIGIATVTVTGLLNRPETKPFAVYNLTPDPGEAAKIGFNPFLIFVEGGIYVRGDYGPRVVFENTNQGFNEVESVSLTIWGVPADSIHDPLRIHREEGVSGSAISFGASSGTPRVPFFTNPTRCGAQPLDFSLTVTSWQQPNESESPPATQMPVGPVVGCDRLGMEPSLTAEPTTTLAYAPTGLDVTAKIPQTYDNPAGLATSHLKKTVVTLPEGMTVNPSAGAGLGACTPAQYEEEAIEAVAGKGCPSDSKLGSFKAKSPALAEEASGSVFLAQPYANPFNSLLAIYVVARIPNRGILVKTAGEVSANPLTGQLLATFDNLPQVPVSSFTFGLRQGATSPLVTPPACGQYTVKAELTPWSAPEATPLMPLVPPFSIANGPDGGACPAGGLPSFSPQVSAGTVNNTAGAYSPLDIRIARNDGEQEITRFSSRLPQGLTAKLTGVPLCPDASIEAARGKPGAQEESEPSCPASSQIGHTLVGVGVGPALVWVPGKVYMAGPYNGAPFSVAAITSAKAGPFDLGTVVVRAAIRVDPDTAQVTVDGAASDPIPHIIKGIVIHARDIRIYIDRQDFTLNPTSCEHLVFSATVNGSGLDPASLADDVPVTVNAPFQAADCASLPFKPSFSVSTQAKTSKKNGASLTVKGSFPAGEANIHAVAVVLPKQLPARLTTIQQACTTAVFNANPAGCPAGSDIGVATARTPILANPLAGPVYLVSHGGAAFPDVVAVLQGEGITVDLTGSVNIKHNITSSTFATVPDEPISSFQLTLPEGPHSGLAAVVPAKAKGNLCGQKLSMPFTITAQNGAVVKQTPRIAITGCAKAKKKAKHRVRRKAKKK